MQPEEFQTVFDVSRETMDKLRAYHKLLFKWQAKINLISDKTLQDSWSRHFADSAQIADLIPESAKTVADLGSGAGFPGLVLAMMRPDLEVHLIESDERKAQFLKTVSRETQTPVHVHTARINDMIGNISPDLVTARALAGLDMLLGFCTEWADQNEALTMIFPKGRQAEEEIEVARVLYDFDLKRVHSCVDEAAQILCITMLKKRA